MVVPRPQSLWRKRFESSRRSPIVNHGEQQLQLHQRPRLGCVLWLPVLSAAVLCPPVRVAWCGCRVALKRTFSRWSRRCLHRQPPGGDGGRGGTRERMREGGSARRGEEGPCDAQVMPAALPRTDLGGILGDERAALGGERLALVQQQVRICRRARGGCGGMGR